MTEPTTKPTTKPIIELKKRSVALYVNQLDNRGTGRMTKEHARIWSQRMGWNCVIWYSARNVDSSAETRFQVETKCRVVAVDPTTIQSQARRNRVEVVCALIHGAPERSVLELFEQLPHSTRIVIQAVFESWKWPLPERPVEYRRISDAVPLKGEDWGKSEAEDEGETECLPLYHCTPRVTSEHSRIATYRFMVRRELKIPHKAVVMFRHGGNDTFNSIEMQHAVDLAIQNDPRVWFVGLNTRQFGPPHRRKLFLEELRNDQAIDSLLWSADIYLHGRAHGETFGLTLLEAAAHGLFVIGHTHCWLLDQIVAAGRGKYIEHGAEMVEWLFERKEFLKFPSNSGVSYTYSIDALHRQFEEVAERCTPYVDEHAMEDGTIEIRIGDHVVGHSEESEAIDWVESELVPFPLHIQKWIDTQECDGNQIVDWLRMFPPVERLFASSLGVEPWSQGLGGELCSCSGPGAFQLDAGGIRRCTGTGNIRVRINPMRRNSPLSLYREGWNDVPSKKIAILLGGGPISNRPDDLGLKASKLYYDRLKDDPEAEIMQLDLEQLLPPGVSREEVIVVGANYGFLRLKQQCDLTVTGDHKIATAWNNIQRPLGKISVLPILLHPPHGCMYVKFTRFGRVLSSNHTIPYACQKSDFFQRRLRPEIPGFFELDEYERQFINLSDAPARTGGSYAFHVLAALGVRTVYTYGMINLDSDTSDSRIDWLNEEAASVAAGCQLELHNMFLDPEHLTPRVAEN